MVGDSRDDEPTFSLCKRRKRNDLVGGKPIQRRPRADLVEQLHGDVVADGLSSASHGSSLIGAKSHSRSSISKERQGRTWLERVGIVADLNVSRMTSPSEHFLRRICHPPAHLPLFKMGGEGDTPHPCDWTSFVLHEGLQGPPSGLHPEPQHAFAPWNITGTHDVKHSRKPHPAHQRKHYVLEMNNG
jgi:hypothetical protein